MPRDTEDEIAEARFEARRARRSHRCQCGDDLPGYCPGPLHCPYSDYAEDDEDDDGAEAAAEDEIDELEMYR